MKKRKKHPSKARLARSKFAPWIGLLILVSLGTAAYVVTRPARNENPSRSLTYVSRPPRTVTFNKHIAPIFLQHCATCHRPGQSAPFSLLSYADAAKRAKQIGVVTRERIMPPWLPEPGCCGFIEERVPNADEVGLIQQWIAEGAAEGNPADLPPPPKWTEGWQLGEPDLIVRMSEAYLLEASGSDVYRNFVIPIPSATRRYVKAVEFQPGNWKVVHHAAMKIDRTRQSRRRDDHEAGPGFAGMNLPESAENPGGHFLNWQPGKLPYLLPEEFAWTLEPNSDLVLQLHVQPTGKPETVQSSVGFYFSATPPTRASFKLVFDWPAIDIAPGVTNYVISDRYVLPADVDAVAVFPHAHYLAKEMRAEAALPNGSTKTLLHIHQWDFNWQGDYRYASPVFLPKGTALTMQFSYDNSTNNARNPNHPPKRVRTGWQTTDEMGELWLQVVPRNRSELAMLARDHDAAALQKMVQVYQQRIAAEPKDGKAFSQLGKTLFVLGRADEAVPHLKVATRLDPTNDEPHYLLGVVCRMKNDSAGARAAFETALRLNPENFKAHGNLGLVSMNEGDWLTAETHLREALRLNPEDAIARESLDRLMRQKR
ncbi:MAG TPA: tetratricopeptide repeat protein [Candidatus Limnocylindria bacterium]|nr:tetratricopeptide repeat protein [Candidatus Limnocylindria bacterium]